MSKPFSFGRDPRVDEILAQIRNGELSRDVARVTLTNIGLEQFSEDYDGNAGKEQTRQTVKTQRANGAR